MAPKKADEGEQKGAARFGRVKNNLKMGLLGLPNVGKSSLFNLLTEQVWPNRQPAAAQQLLI
jgi:obg-like ATPase 1